MILRTRGSEHRVTIAAGSIGCAPAQQFQTMSALQNMQSYEQIAEAHAWHLQKLVSTFEGLHNAMSDQQKRLADQVFRAKAVQHQQSAAQPHYWRNG